MSRRDFLKLLGAGATIGIVGSFLRFPSNSARAISPVNQFTGTWTNNITTTYPAIHNTILKNGKILYVSGTGWNGNLFPDPSTGFTGGPYRSGIVDPMANGGSGSETMLPDQPDDVFCCGFAQIANGKVLVAGGTIQYDTVQAPFGNGKNWGGSFAYEYDPDNGPNGTLYKVPSMAHGRWYPSMGTLPSGKIFCMTGLDELGATNLLSEIYDPTFKTWNIKLDPTSTNSYSISGITYNKVNPSTSLYVRTIIMPSGLIFAGGQGNQMFVWNASDSTLAGLAPGTWVKTVKMSVGDPNVDQRTYGCGILLPLQNTASERGKVLLVGGRLNNGSVTASVEQMDFTNSDTAPSITTKTSLNHGRMYTLPVILPNGKIIIFGGVGNASGTTVASNTAYIFTPEMYDPAANTWTDLPFANSTSAYGRTYHSVALLLQDGSIWMSSGTPNTHESHNVSQIFKPWYFNSEARPTISAQPADVNTYGGTISISTPDASSITKVSLIRLPNQTHHHDAEHRMIWLQIQSNSNGTVVATAPINANIAPPGYYYIHVLKPHSQDPTADIPSMAKIIHIGPKGVYLNVSAPTVGILKPSGNGNILGNQVTIEGTAGSPNGTITGITINITPISPTGAAIPPITNAQNIDGDWSYWRTTTTLTPGHYTIKATATDNNGNQTSTQISINVFG